MQYLIVENDNEMKISESEKDMLLSIKAIGHTGNEFYHVANTLSFEAIDELLSKKSNNEFTYKNVNYCVLVKQGFAGQQMAEVFKQEDKTKPIVGGSFAKNVIFDVIMDWAKKCAAKLIAPQQRQFEQVVNKLRSQLAAMEETLLMMPRKGDNPATCQRINISNYLGGIDSCINGIELEDFTANEYSTDFKLSYS